MINQDYKEELKSFAEQVRGENIVKVILEKEFDFTQTIHPLEKILSSIKVFPYFHDSNEPDTIIDLQKKEVRFPLKRDISLNSFIMAYCDKSFKLLENDSHSLNNFYRDLQKKLREEIGISRNDFTYIHHLFHWTYFIDKNESPFEMYWSKNKKKNLCFRLKRKPSTTDKENLRRHIDKKYGNLLLKRSKDFLSINILPQ